MLEKLKAQGLIPDKPHGIDCYDNNVEVCFRSSYSLTIAQMRWLVDNNISVNYSVPEYVTFTQEIK